MRTQLTVHVRPLQLGNEPCAYLVCCALVGLQTPPGSVDVIARAERIRNVWCALTLGVGCVCVPAVLHAAAVPVRSQDSHRARHHHGLSLLEQLGWTPLVAAPRSTACCDQ